MPEQPNTRVYSGEFEYGIVYNGDNAVPSEFWKKLPGPLKYAAGLNMRVNGSRIYPDCGHVEYAMPECGNLDDYVHAELAGEAIIIETMAAITADDNRRSYRIQKRAIDSLGTNYGAHESYNVKNNIRFSQVSAEQKKHTIGALAALYAVRMVIVGGGHYSPETNAWMVSQRYNCFDRLTSKVCHSTGDRPLVDTRDEPFADSRYRRLHVSSGDPNVSLWALRAKIGLTSGYLRLLEAGEDVSELFLESPVKTARQVSIDTNLVYKLRRIDGKKMTALNQIEAISERILTFAENNPGSVPDDEATVAQMVHDTSIKASHDANELLYKADWKTRMATSEIIAREKSNSDDELITNLAATDQYYDALAIKKYSDDKVYQGTGKLLREKGRFGSYDASAVERLKTNPPTSSRALLRGKLIEAAQHEEVIRAYGKITSANWDRIEFDVPDKQIDLSDPVRTDTNRMMRRILRAGEVSLD